MNFTVNFAADWPVLLQSTMHFLPQNYWRNGGAQFEQQTELQRGLQAVQLELIRAQLPQAAQVPLGLLLGLQLQGQRELVPHFVEDDLSTLRWYEQSITGQNSRALILQPQLPASYRDATQWPFFQEHPWSLPRFSPAAKQQLTIRLLGLRLSVSELLLLLGFMPLSRLLAGPEALQTTAEAGKSLAVERQLRCEEILAMLDYHLFELFGTTEPICYVEDLLRKDYRQSLAECWQRLSIAKPK